MLGWFSSAIGGITRELPGWTLLLLFAAAAFGLAAALFGAAAAFGLTGAIGAGCKGYWAGF